MTVDLSPHQVEALASMQMVLAADRWALIGASAIGCRLPLPRPTLDVDFAVAVSAESLHERLLDAGWARHPTQLQRWLRAGAMIDVVPATDEDLLAGVARLEDGFELTVIGFDLAFTETDSVPIRAGLEVPVPRIPVLVLLKMITWLDRPNERQKDLEDIVFMLDKALPEEDERRWDAAHPLGAASLDYEDQSAFFVGWQLGRIAGPEHLHWSVRFVDRMRDDQSIAFAQLVKASRYAGNDVELRLRARLTAFVRGVELGTTPSRAPVMQQSVSSSRRGIAGGAWSRSLEMLVHDAIDRHRVVHFDYDGVARVAEPHVLGTKDGRSKILTWQTGGRSSSDPLPGWREFFLDKISRLELTNEMFSGPRPRPGGHRHFDRQMAVVRSG